MRMTPAEKRKKIVQALVDGIDYFDRLVARGEFPRQLPEDRARCVLSKLDAAGLKVVSKRTAS